ncbi:MAG: NADP-dependent oxidoreductase [Rhodospirillaceae bacterium]|mgnify:CR=1 FL=1|nr:NADP-dependent oxidoreductase [Rhodospirillaceae bacterium]HAA93111.1 NADP-dependent oxidoreductase [Rhodospirillaceae bacterium]
MPTNTQVLLKRRPDGEPSESDFEIVTTDLPSLEDGQILTRTIYLSLDPYMRGRMSDARSYAEPTPVGGVMTGGTVSVVEESKNERFKAGDIVVTHTGWQAYAVSDGKGVRTLRPIEGVPISTGVGVLGMPGMTAYVGLKNIGEPKEGETLVVAAASGPVGATVGQIAKIKGCRTVGVAGGPEKCDYAVKEFGFDACLDHRADDFEDQLAAACPDGIDVYWENVAGRVLEAVIPHLNFFSRMPVCGLISQYSMTDLPEGTNKLPLLMRAILTNRTRVQGFIVTDYGSDFKDFITDMTGWVESGQVKFKEHRIKSLENAPGGLLGLLKGDNFGKTLVEVSDDPTI